MKSKVVLITGAGRRLGAAIARTLHAEGMNVVLHYRSSAKQAKVLCNELNQIRNGTSATLQGNLLHTKNIIDFVQNASKIWNRLDVLVNNASTFYPTPVADVTEKQWDELMGSNLKAPFFLCQAASPLLSNANGCIVNIVDIHAERPLIGHPVYSVTKAGLVSMTRALARELAPEIRVNGVAPGAILWPKGDVSNEEKNEILDRIALERVGSPNDVARAVLFFIRDANYITGQILSVDGGRTLFG